MRRGALLAGLLCAVLYGPERVPLDELTHWEVRVKLCTRANEPWVVVETRTYQRTRTASGWEERALDGTSPPPDWREEKRTRLYVTTTPQAQEGVSHGDPVVPVVP